MVEYRVILQNRSRLALLMTLQDNLTLAGTFPDLDDIYKILLVLWLADILWYLLTKLPLLHIENQDSMSV